MDRDLQKKNKANMSRSVNKENNNFTPEFCKALFDTSVCTN